MEIRNGTNTKMAYCHKQKSPATSKLAMMRFAVGICFLLAGNQSGILVLGYPAGKSSGGGASPAGSSIKQTDISTSSPIAAAVEAAAAAALGTIGSSSSSIGSASTLNDDYGLRVSSSASTTTTTSGGSGSIIDIVTTRQAPTTNAPSLTKIVSVISSHAQTTSVAPQLISSTSTTVIHKLHKHNGNKKVNIIDKLHKFDLFIDPVCERLSKLSEKQLNRVYLQLKQFSLHVSYLQVSSTYHCHY